MISDIIKNFPKQLEFDPIVENKDGLAHSDKFIVAGMGGSHLAADLLNVWNPNLKLIVHSDYGLPALSPAELKENLIIASSYSGNTEETIDAFRYAISQGFKTAAISTGGELLKIATEHKAPYIKLPDTKIQPRSAVGFSIVASLKLMGAEKELGKLKALARKLNPQNLETEGKGLAERIRGLTPIIYSSTANFPIAYNWKIRFNETGKIPAFCNAIPEANHNEILGFALGKQAKIFSDRFAFIFLSDQSDHPRVSKRMKILSELYRKNNLKVKNCGLGGKNVWDKIFHSLILADWTAYWTAKIHGLDPEEEKLVEGFKSQMAE